METMETAHNETNSTNTAHLDWDVRWQTEEGRADWIKPEQFVVETIPFLKQQGVRKVLDLGCGVGRHALLLAREGFEVHAVDASPAAMAFLAEQAEIEGLHIHQHQSEMTEIPFPADTFDYLLTWNVIYHGDLPVVLRSIAEILRVLKPGGLFQGTMLSKRNTEISNGRRIAKDTYINNEEFEKRHPHFYCSAQDLLSLFSGFEPLTIMDGEHRRKGSYHWHILAEKI